MHTVRSLYWQELWDYVPKTGKRASPPSTPGVSTNSVIFAAPPLPPHSESVPAASSTGFLSPILAVQINSNRHGLDCDNHIKRPAWKTSDKQPHFFLISLTVYNIKFSY